MLLGRVGDAEESTQVVLGVTPWRWAPAAVTLRAADGPVRLRDDPAYVDLLRACAAMPDDGIAAAVVGLGFLACRSDATVGANLERFGVHVTGVVALPRGMFLPASAPGRALLVLRRRRSPPVVVRWTGLQRTSAVNADPRPRATPVR